MENFLELSAITDFDIEIKLPVFWQFAGSSRVGICHEGSEWNNGDLCKQNAYKYLFNYGLSHISISHYLCTFAVNQRREKSAFSSFFPRPRYSLIGPLFPFPAQHGTDARERVL